MQLLRTDVNHVTGPKGQPILQVMFCGEGGDCVTVDMTSVDLPDDASAIERARAILVQTATFNLAANDYDARSNGSFDELSVTTASAGRKPESQKLAGFDQTSERHHRTGD